MYDSEVEKSFLRMIANAKAECDFNADSLSECLDCLNNASDLLDNTEHEFICNDINDVIEVIEDKVQSCS